MAHSQGTPNQQTTERRLEDLFPMVLICQRYGHRQDLFERPPCEGPIRCAQCASPMTICYQNGEPLP